VRSPEGTTLTRIPPENTGAPHLEARKAEGRDGRKRSEACLLLGRSTPFKRQISPLVPPKRHGRSLPRRAPRFPPYDTGARPHTSYRLTRRRSVQLPSSYAPLHSRGNQRSGRRTTAQGACNHPTVKRPFIFAVTSGQKGEPPRKKRTTAPRLCAPSASLQPAVQHGGLGPHVMQPARRLPGAEKSHRRLCQCHVFSGPLRKSEKISFSEPVQRLKAPHAWPNSDIKYESHGPVSHGNRRSSRHDHRRADSNYINRRAGAVGQPPIKLWPHLQTRILL
jgi:hypothetical protein